MILDTNALSAWLDGDPAIEARLSAAPGVVLSVIALGEYRFGVLFSRYRVEYEQRIALVETDLTVVGTDSETAGHYASIRKELKDAGTPIPWHDLWIAAQARQHAMPVLSRDTHFDHVRGITRITW
jgi:predicted nucleic acid-binding protein